MVWPFSSSKAKVQPLSEEEGRRCQRKCGLAKSSLNSCWAANGAHRSRCDSLENQVVFCHAEVLCPELAWQHQQCFMRVVASKGEEPLSACNVHVEAMKACLRQRGVYPFA